MSTPGISLANMHFAICEYCDNEIYASGRDNPLYWYHAKGSDSRCNPNRDWPRAEPQTEHPQERLL